MKELEIELINRAVKGDKKAFCTLVKMHRVKLRSFAVNITGDQATADDILQEALLKAFFALPRYENKGSFTTWLWRIIKNEFVNYLRSPAAKVVTATVDVNENDGIFKTSEDGESTLLDKETKKNIKDLVAELPEKLRIAIILVDLEEMCYDDAAEIMGISLTALKARVFKGRRKLVKIVEEKIKKETTLKEKKPLKG